MTTHNEQSFPAAPVLHRAWRSAKAAVWIAIALAALLGLYTLESDRRSVAYNVVQSPAGDLHFYHVGPTFAGPLVVVAHGFGGSVQLMQTISRDLAKAGFTVAAFDYIGHGRSDARLSTDITSLYGTTAQLTRQNVAIVEAARDAVGRDTPYALLGHSMATDILIRSAAELGDTGAIVAISMYSEAITADFPANLLVISGEWEGRLRDAGLNAVEQIDPEALEFETVTREDITRRTVYAPRTEHVAVLFSQVTLQETRDWLARALGVSVQGTPAPLGWVLLGTLGAVAALIFPLARLVPASGRTLPDLSTLRFLGVLAASGLGGAAGVFLMPGSVLGIAALGHFFGFCLGWGAVACLVLYVAGRRPEGIALRGSGLLIAWGLLFSLALDRYGASFAPSGPRAELMLLLFAGAVPFMLADRLLLHGAPVWRRVVARAAPILVLSSVMVAAPTQVGLMFTVLPVMLLFYAVFGTMSHAIACRCGPEAAAYGLAPCLAWAIASSTPLFAG